MKKLTILILLTLLLSTCSFKLPSRYERNGADVGYGANELKKSKCACKPFYKNGEFI